MDTAPSDFPFDILDVAQLLHLNIRRRQAESAYADCPFCGDKRGKLNLNFAKNVWRCTYCDAHGGMLALYARAHGTTNSAAFHEICDALQTGETGWSSESSSPAMAGGSFGESPAAGRLCEKAPRVTRADAQTVHQTLSLLFNMLTLKPEHLAHLKSDKRGLTDEQIKGLGFKSTPPYHECRSLTARIVAQGYTVEGIPGFYQDKDGCWTVAFSSHAAGILIPAVDINGFLCGAQILLDKPFKDADAPPEKSGTKYIWFSSGSKPMGTGSGSPVHFVGDPSSRVIYVTEGLLKADIAHCLTGRSFVAVAGANNVRGLDKVFSMLAQNGTELILEALDMDKCSNAMVAKGSSEIFRIAKAHGIECRSLTWNPNYKGIDDWQLSLRQKARETKCENGRKAVPPEKELGKATENECPAAASKLQCKTQHFRLYQLAFDGQQPISFAFRGIGALHRAGYTQPPASLYRLVLDTGLPRAEAQTDENFLWDVRERCREGLPQSGGRPIAASDVVELYSSDERRYFYVGPSGFVQTQFSPFLVKRTQMPQ